MKCAFLVREKRAKKGGAESRKRLTCGRCNRGERRFLLGKREERGQWDRQSGGKSLKIGVNA